MTEEFTISTTLSSEEFKQRIQKLLNKKWGIPFLYSKPVYKGEIFENSFKITSEFDNPPIVLKGKLIDDKIEVKVNWDSMKSAYKYLVFGLGFPIVFMVLFFIIYENPNSFFSYFFCIAILFAFYLFQKIIVRINYQEPNPKTIVNDLKKVLK